ncbi:MAG: lysine--tRNA ligase [Firmicutes bacterium]|nr:lysine--tRNA ligase [Bacillota bacterium]
MESNENRNMPEQAEEQFEQTEEQLSEQRKIRREKLQNLRDAGRDPFLNETWDVNAHSKTIKDNFDAMDGKEVSIAGRIMTKRIMGKAAFIDLQDKEGRIQSYVKRDDIGEEDYKWFKTYDIGDIVGIVGKVFKTQTGEISVHAEKLVLLSKSLQVLPDKFKGLVDQDIRYRQRYVDLIMNPEVKETFIKRAKIVKEIKRVLEEKYGFLEVDTPILTTIAGGANARPFDTHHNTLDLDMKLRISNELFLKRLIVGGLDRVYEMGKMFRNEGMDRNHNPEFTSMECYMAYGNMESVMDVTEQVVYNAAMAVNGTPIITYQGKSFDVTPPWKRLNMADAVKEITGVDFDKIESDEDARKAAIGYGMDPEEVSSWTRGKIIAEMFEEYCEEVPGYLDGPVFVVGHPVEISPLAKRDPADPRITRRFEAYINGWEVANAFSELNDPIDQYERFVEQQRQLDTGADDEAHPMDMDFVNALEVGLPPTGGLGIGIDRVIMLITDAPSIRDIILFPTMKPLDEKGKKSEGGEAEKKVIDFSKVEIEPLFTDYVDFDTFSKSDFRAVKVLECTEVPKSKKLLRFVLDDGTPEKRVILSGIKEFYSPEELVGKTCIAIVNLPPRQMMGETSNGMLISAVNDYDGGEMLNLLIVDDNIPAGAKLY